LPERAVRFLSVDAVKAIHVAVIAAHGGRRGIRQLALLESAVAAPQASFEGRRLLAKRLELAAAYLFYLCRNHPFVDGNKRTALASCLVFLEANGLIADADWRMQDVDAWEALVVDVASSRVDRAQTTRRLRALLRAARKALPSS
jgi:death-on-curing protein